MTKMPRLFWLSTSVVRIGLLPTVNSRLPSAEPAICSNGDCSIAESASRHAGAPDVGPLVTPAADRAVGSNLAVATDPLRMSTRTIDRPSASQAYSRPLDWSTSGSPQPYSPGLGISIPEPTGFPSVSNRRTNQWAAPVESFGIDSPHRAAKRSGRTHVEPTQ